MSEKSTLQKIVCSLILFSVCTKSLNGGLTLNSSGSATLCPGDQLHLTCNSSSESFLVLWTVFDTNNDMDVYTRHAGASPSDGIRRPLPLQFGSFTFNIASQVVNNIGSSDLSLISNITVHNVNAALNATVIICTEVATGNQDMVTVNVIDTNEVTDFSTIVNISEPVFGINNVTVDITIQQDEHSNLRSYVSALVMYDISFSSTVEKVLFDVEEYIQTTDSLIFTISVPYNVQGNLSIVPTLCGLSAREVPFNTSFYYTNCGHLVFSNSVITINEKSVRTFPVIEGITFNFSCPFGHVLTGPSTTTCMENGEWEPDPGLAKCIAYCGHPVFSNLTYTFKEMSVETFPVTEGSTFNFSCPFGRTLHGPNASICMENGEWEPDLSQANCTALEPRTGVNTTILIIVSSVAAFILSSLACGILCIVICRRVSNRSKAASNQDTGPIYDEITSVRNINTELEMEQNAAYSTSQRNTKPEMEQNAAYSTSQRNTEPEMEQNAAYSTSQRNTEPEMEQNAAYSTSQRNTKPEMEQNAAYSTSISASMRQ